MTALTYDEARLLRSAYRDAARACVREVEGAGVDHHAHVHLMQDGAFVEVTLWVPRAAVEAKGQE